MKHPLLILLFLCTSLTAFCQNSDKELFDLGIQQYSTDKHQSIETFKKVVKKYPKSKFYSISIYNLGQIFFELDSMSQAKYWFDFAINAKFIDNIDWYNFPDTHSNIRHKSSHDLGHIYYKKADYSNALNYYFKALNEFPYYSTSGTSTKKNNYKVRRWISDCYLHLNDTTRAINILISDAVTASPWMGNPAAKLAIDLISIHKGKDAFLEEFNTSLLSMKKKKNLFIINLYGEDIIIYPYAVSSKELTIEAFQKDIKESEFYIGLTK